ncbi:MAG: AAA family ATPase, partial [Acidimicrobiia bacterium]|nr:AAA family ATPase [Acidimicrobiia bacterium]
DELRRLIQRTLEDLGARRVSIDLDAAGVDRLVAALGGLSMREAEHLVQQAAFRDGQLTGDDISGVRRAKAELLSADGILELVEAEVGTLDEVGGLDGLKQWLRVRRAAHERGGMEAARGILLTGVPGCGKSFVAKSLARTWDLPLVLLDPSRLYRCLFVSSGWFWARIFGPVLGAGLGVVLGLGPGLTYPKCRCIRV